MKSKFVTSTRNFFLGFISCILLVLCLMVFTETPGISEYKYIKPVAEIYKNAKAQWMLPVQSFQNTSTTNETKSVFSTALSTFGWNGFKQALTRRNITEETIWFEQLIRLLGYFIVMEPKVPVNSSCQAPDLLPPNQLGCALSKYGNGFSGQLNTKIPKIGILIQFGFHVDVLEIYLNEVYDVMDQFFIIESTQSHYRTLRKGLMWEAVKNQERFWKFAPKITHLIIDAAEAAHVLSSRLSDTPAKAKWHMEYLQEELRWTKFLEWNKEHKFFTDDDLLSFGDADEIPARKMIHMLKHCSLRESTVDFGIWFAYGNVHTVYASNYPVPGHKYTLGNPTFWKLQAATQYNNRTRNYPTRRRGRGNTFVLGGIHMTSYRYLPNDFMRKITCSECGSEEFNSAELDETVAAIKSDQIRKLEIRHNAKGQVLVELKDVRVEMAEIAILPWFYECNRDRYPAWEGKHDTRLD